MIDSDTMSTLWPHFDEGHYFKTPGGSSVKFEAPAGEDALHHSVIFAPIGTGMSMLASMLAAQAAGQKPMMALDRGYATERFIRRAKQMGDLQKDCRVFRRDLPFGIAMDRIEVAQDQGLISPGAAARKLKRVRRRSKSTR